MAVQATDLIPSGGIGSTLPVQNGASSGGASGGEGGDGGFLGTQPVSKPTTPADRPPSAGQGGEVYVQPKFLPGDANDVNQPSSGLPGGLPVSGSVHDAHAPFHFVDGDTCHVGYTMWMLPDGSVVCISDLEYAKAQIGDLSGYLSQFYGPATGNSDTTTVDNGQTTDTTTVPTGGGSSVGSGNTAGSDDTESSIDKLIGLIGQQFASGGTTAQDGQGSVVALPTEIGATQSSGSGKAIGIALLFIAGGVGYYFYRRHKKKTAGAT